MASVLTLSLSSFETYDFFLKEGNHQTLPDIMISAINKMLVFFFSPLSISLKIALPCVFWSRVSGVGTGPASFCTDILPKKDKKKKTQTI